MIDRILGILRTTSTRAAVCGSFLLWLGALAWLTPAAGAQGVGYSGTAAGGGSEHRIWIEPVLWQQGGPPGPPAGRGPRRRPMPPPGLPPLLLERLKNLPPEQREKVLENNRRFQQLPPERQQQLRERLRKLQELTPGQRELIEQRFAIFRNLTPEQQEKARKLYEDRWRGLAPGRRRALLEEFRRLRALGVAERKQRMDSGELQSHFSSDERDLLAQLISL